MVQLNKHSQAVFIYNIQSEILISQLYLLIVGTQRQPFQPNLLKNFSIKLSRLSSASNVRKTDEKSLKSE